MTWMGGTLRIVSAIGLAAALGLTTACSQPPIPGPKIDATLMSMIPADAVTLAGVRLDKLRMTPLYSKIETNRVMAFVDDFAKQTNIDPRKDLWELLYVGEGKRSAVIARGKFTDESEPSFKGKGGSRFNYKGVNLFGDDGNAILMFNPTTFGAGDTVLLKKMIDAKDTSKGEPPALAAVLKDIPADAQIWGAYTGGPITIPFDLPGNFSNVNRLAAGVQNVSLYFDLRTSLNGLITADCTNEAEAQQTEAAIKAAIGLGRLSTPTQQADLQRVFDSLRATQEGKVARLHIDIAPELVEKAIALVPQAPSQPEGRAPTKR